MKIVEVRILHFQYLINSYSQGINISEKWYSEKNVLFRPRITKKNFRPIRSFLIISGNPFAQGGVRDEPKLTRELVYITHEVKIRLA